MKAEADTKIQLSEIIAFQVNFVTWQTPRERYREIARESACERETAAEIKKSVKDEEQHKLCLRIELVFVMQSIS